MIPTTFSPMMGQLLQQPQTSDQFQQFFVVLARMLAHMQADQAAIQADQGAKIQQELEEIRRVNCELHALQQKQKTHKVRHSADAADPDQKAKSVAKNGNGSSATPPNHNKLTASRGAERAPARPSGEAAHCDPPREGLVDDEVHSWLTDRIASLQETRQNSWQKLVNFVRRR
jgi:hypothetical protein